MHFHNSTTTMNETITIRRLTPMHPLLMHKLPSSAVLNLIPSAYVRTVYALHMVMHACMRMRMHMHAYIYIYISKGNQRSCTAYSLQGSRPYLHHARERITVISIFCLVTLIPGSGLYTVRIDNIIQLNNKLGYSGNPQNTLSSWWRVRSVTGWVWWRVSIGDRINNSWFVEPGDDQVGSSWFTFMTNESPIDCCCTDQENKITVELR